MLKKAAFVLALCFLFASVVSAFGESVELYGIKRTENPSAFHKVLIRFKTVPGPDEEAALRAVGGKVKFVYKIVHGMAAEIPEAAIDALLAHPRVTHIEKDGEVHALDAELDYSWGVMRTGAGTVHDGGNRGAGVKVAVIDTGIDYTHPDLDGNYAGGVDFVNGDTDPMDDNLHGTHVAGIIAAEDDGAGVVGMAPLARLYALKVLDSGGAGSWSNIIAALDWAVANGIQVTNNSYGASGYPGLLVSEAFANAYASGLLNVAAAGNSGTSCSPPYADNVGYPAKLDSVIAVGATGANDLRACFSSTGPDVELAAPGDSIYSCFPCMPLFGCYWVLSGTSMASPHAAGAAALVIASGITDKNGDGRINDEVRERLDGTAADLGDPGRDWLYGYGLVDAARAVNLAPPAPPPALPELGVKNITYTARPGKKKPVNATIAVASGTKAVGGAAVTVTVTRSAGGSWSGTGTTNSLGNVTFSINNLVSGCCTTTVTNITATGYLWDGISSSADYCR